MKVLAERGNKEGFGGFGTLPTSRGLQAFQSATSSRLIFRAAWMTQ